VSRNRAFTLTPTSDPAVFDFADVTVGHASRIGAFTGAATEIDNLATGTINNGVFIQTTPSGDTISWKYSGFFLRTGTTTFAFFTSGIVTGGTGRFQRCDRHCELQRHCGCHVLRALRTLRRNPVSTGMTRDGRPPMVLARSGPPDAAAGLG
jgi:hypothetical protein